MGLGVGLALEAAIGAFITAPLAVWWLRRNLSDVVDSFLEDKELVARIRDHFVKGAFGGLGGRPGSIKNQIAQMGIQMGGAMLAQRMGLVRPPPPPP